MTVSKRSEILEALEDRLEAITVANGYRRTIVTVAHEAKDWAEVPTAAMDWLGIVPLTETFTDQPGHVISDWSIAVIAHLAVATPTAESIRDAIVDLASDIRKKLYTAPSNLGVEHVHYVSLVSRDGAESDPAAVAMGVASCVFKLNVRFEEGLTDS